MVNQAEEVFQVTQEKMVQPVKPVKTLTVPMAIQANQVLEVPLVFQVLQVLMVFQVLLVIQVSQELVI
jgi:hypothetical protein